MAGLLDGAGLRLLECLELRVKDVDFERRQITVRQGKGRKDRITMLPGSIVAPLAKHLEATPQQDVADLARGFGAVALPHALDGKDRNAARDGPGNSSSQQPTSVETRGGAHPSTSTNP